MKEFCVDLEIAKELEKEGFIQNTHFYHRIQKDGIGEFTDFCDTKSNSPFMKFKALYSAPTSDELLKELPECILGKNTSYHHYIWKEAIAYRDDNIELICFYDKKLTNALAKMWLYLKKEGYIK